MKTNYLFLASAIFAIAFASCSKNNDDPRPEGETNEVYIDASSGSIWHYYSLSEGKVVGSAEESVENNAVWGVRTDWDMAVRTRNIRTNSGDFTTAGARGGVHIFDLDKLDKYGNNPATTTFSSVKNLSGTEVFQTDKPIALAVMGGEPIFTVCSEALTVQMQKDGDGSIMPPVFLKAPVYIFRSADGENYYKVEFTQYKSDEGVSGHLKFNVAQIYK